MHTKYAYEIRCFLCFHFAWVGIYCFVVQKYTQWTLAAADCMRLVVRSTHFYWNQQWICAAIIKIRWVLSASFGLGRVKIIIILKINFFRWLLLFVVVLVLDIHAYLHSYAFLLIFSPSRRPAFSIAGYFNIYNNKRGESEREEESKYTSWISVIALTVIYVPSLLLLFWLCVLPLCACLFGWFESWFIFYVRFIFPAVVSVTAFIMAARPLYLPFFAVYKCVRLTIARCPLFVWVFCQTFYLFVFFSPFFFSLPPCSVRFFISLWVYFSLEFTQNINIAFNFSRLCGLRLLFDVNWTIYYSAIRTLWSTQLIFLLSFVEKTA